MRRISSKVKGYWKRARFETDQFRSRLAARHRHTAFNAWLHELNTSQAEIFVGSNFVDFGGCRHHMHGIRKFSGKKVALIPSERALKRVPAGAFMNEFFEGFLASPPPASVRAVHSHVFPWFVEWCHRYRSHQIRWVHTHHLWYYNDHTRNGLPLDSWQEELNHTFLFALRNCDVPLSVSKWQQRFLKKEHDIETHYLPNGVDVSLCDRGRASRFRKRHDIIKPFILWAGRNDPVKNPSDFVRLAQIMPDTRFIMLGPDLSPEVMQTEWDIDSPPNLLFPGRATHAEVQDALAACSALVVTSYREGLPTLVLEGMTHGRAIVAIEEDGSAEALGDGDFGFLARKSDISHLAETLSRALCDQERPRAARARVLEEYDWRVVAPKLDAIYQAAP